VKSIITLRASGAVYCNRSCLCVCGGRAGGVCDHDNYAPGKGVCGGGDFGSTLLQPSRTLCVYGGTAAGAQCLRLSERFFIAVVYRSAANLTDVEVDACRKDEMRALE